MFKDVHKNLVVATLLGRTQPLPRPHTFVLLTAAEEGIPSLAAQLFLLGHLFASVISGRGRGGRLSRSIGLGLLVVLGINSLVFVSALEYAVMPLLVALLGSTAAGWHDEEIRPMGSTNPFVAGMPSPVSSIQSGRNRNRR